MTTTIWPSKTAMTVWPGKIPSMVGVANITVTADDVLKDSSKLVGSADVTFDASSTLSRA